MQIVDSLSVKSIANV